MTADQQPPATNGVDADALTETILSAVERQLTRYFAAMSQQADVARQTADAARTELDAITGRLPLIEAALDSQNEGFGAYQSALQSALEERLTEFATAQHWRLTDLEEKVEAIPTGLSSEDLLEVRQAVRDDMERSFAAINGRIDELLGVQKRFDEHSAQVVLHVDEVTSSLAQRIDEGDAQVTAAVEQLLQNAQDVFTSTLADIEAQVGEHTSSLLQKLDAADSRVTDRMLALEARINEEQGTKLANLEATVGRIGAGFDEAMVAINQRVLDLENRLLSLTDRFDELARAVSRIDQDGIDDLKQQMSNAVGEAMLVRIELDRVVTTTEERFDKQAVRMAEIESLLADEMDVSTAIQLERLDELERAVAMLDPASFAGSTLTHAPAPAPAPATSMFGEATSSSVEAGSREGQARAALSPLSLNPRQSGADIPAHHAGTTDVPAYDMDSTYTSR